MSGKLDQSLDEIMKDRKPTGGKRGARAGRLPARKAAAKSKAATTAVIAPTGGVQKKTRAPKGPKLPIVAPPTGESKVSVSNLPEDVTEALIKDYFGSIVAPVKRVILNYGPNGRSRGSATVIFNKPTAAHDAVKHDGVKVDGRPLRIEVLLGARNVAPSAGPKPLQERISKPKNAAQEGQKKKQKETPAQAATNGAAKGGRDGKKKSGRAGKPKAKTAEELDAEMKDYFGSGEGAATNGSAQSTAAVANGGDMAIDEVM